MPHRCTHTSALLRGLFASIGAILVVASTAHADLVTGLVAHYTFDNPAQLGNDSSATNNDGTAVGNAAFNSNTVIGAGSLALDGNGDAIVAVSNAAVENQNFTVAAWINTASINGNIVDKFTTGGFSGDSFRLQLTSPGIGARVTFTPNNEQNFGGFGTVALNTWQHAVMTYDGSAVRSYLDGALVGTSPFVGTVQYGTPRDLVIGARGTATSGSIQATYFSGLIDDVRVYDRALTGSEIDQLALNVAGPPLKVDFGNFEDSGAPVQTGFSNFTITADNTNTSASYGVYSVTVRDTGPSVSFADRLRTPPANSGAFTQSDLMRDFVIIGESVAGQGIEVEISGLVPSTQLYEMTVWAYDGNLSGENPTVTKQLSD